MHIIVYAQIDPSICSSKLVSIWRSSYSNDYIHNTFKSWQIIWKLYLSNCINKCIFIHEFTCIDINQHNELLKRKYVIYMKLLSSHFPNISSHPLMDRSSTYCYLSDLIVPYLEFWKMLVVFSYAWPHIFLLYLSCKISNLVCLVMFLLLILIHNMNILALQYVFFRLHILQENIYIFNH